MRDKTKQQDPLNRLKVLCLNLDSINPQILQRTEQFIATVKNNDWDIICLQELILPSVKEKIYTELQNEYFVCFSDLSYKQLVYPYLSYIPSIFFLMIALILPTIQFLNQFFYILAFLILPQVIIPTAIIFIQQMQIKILKLDTLGNDFIPDLQGLGILVSKKYFEKPVELIVQPYSNQGYPITYTIKYWIQRTLFRPGYMIFQLQHKKGIQIILGNSHMVIGDDNYYNRVYQSQQLKQDMTSKTNSDSVQIICGDFNVPCFEYQQNKQTPELQVLTQDNYRDTGSVFESVDTRITDQKQCVTWCGITNPEVKKQHPGIQQRLDYIFVKDSLKNNQLIEIHHKLQFDNISGTPIVSDHYGVQTLFDIKYDNKDCQKDNQNKKQD